MYTLVLLLVLAGPQGSSRSVATTHVSGFASKAQCLAAAPKAERAFAGQVGQGLGGAIAFKSLCLKVSGKPQ